MRTIPYAITLFWSDAMGRKLLRISEVADMLDVPLARAYEMAREDIIPVVRLGRQLRVDPDRFDAWIRAGGQPLPGGWRKG